jgi:transposase
MTTMPRITAGVDTHLDVHVVAALDSIGGLLGVQSFTADISGYRSALRWLRHFGDIDRVGIEGTSSYGAGLTRVLLDAGVEVIEVDRPNRQVRRRQGKSDPIDAVAAARAAQSGEASGLAKTKDGAVEAIRVLRIARCSARKERSRAINQMRSIISTAPDELRSGLRGLPIPRLIGRAAGLRPGRGRDVVAATKLALRCLARRAQELENELELLDAELAPLVAAAAPELVSRHGVGTDTAGALLVAAGDNPHRLHSEAAFARLCGVAPLQATTGKQRPRHRLNRGGDRQANAALWRIAMVRLKSDPATKDYLERRIKDGHTKKEAIRCLKRYIAREVFQALPTTT